MNSDTQLNTPEITGAQAQDRLDELKKKLRRLNWRNALLTVLLIVVLLFSIYKRYDEGVVYAKRFQRYLKRRALFQTQANRRARGS